MSRKGGWDYDADDDYYDDYDDYDEDDGYGDYDEYAVGGGQPKGNSNAAKSPSNAKGKGKGVNGGKQKSQPGTPAKKGAATPKQAAKASPTPATPATATKKKKQGAASEAALASGGPTGAAAGAPEEKGGEAAKGEKRAKASSSSASSSKESKESKEAKEAKELEAKQLSECLKELEQLEAGGSKSNILLVVLGHVDAGKSTLMGRLLAELGLFGEKEVRKRAHQASQIGKASFGWAWLMDERPEERERGVTIDIAKRVFETDKRQVTILDAPGHRDFVPNAISGISQADAALLVIDGSVGGFESGFEKRGQISGQTREHAQLAKGIGIEQIAVVVTKLDKSPESEARFAEIRGKLEPFLRSCGYQGEGSVQWLLASGISGDNVVAPPAPGSPLGWFDGPTVVQAIDRFALEGRHRREGALRVPIFAVSSTKPGGGGDVVATGRVTSGFVRAGAKVEVMYGAIRTAVKGIVRNSAQQKASFALAGDAVELTLAHEDPSCFEIGSVVCSPADVIRVSDKIEVQIATLELAQPFTLGQSVVVHCHAATAQAKIGKLVCLHDPKTGEKAKKKPRLLKSFQTASVQLHLAKSICVDTYKDCPSLGRLVLRVGGATVAVGKVTKVYEMKNKG